MSKHKRNSNGYRHNKRHVLESEQGKQELESNKRIEELDYDIISILLDDSEY